MIKDSGKREEFSTGAVRDTQEGKGRMDLIPLDCLPKKYANDPALLLIDKFKKTGNYKFIEHAIEYFICHHFPDGETSLLELGVHYEEGAKKYGDNNWQLGLPTSRYISSAIRHYMEFLRGDPDEPHKRSFIWNLTCIIWTCKHKPELNDYAKAQNIVPKNSVKHDGLYPKSIICDEMNKYYSESAPTINPKNLPKVQIVYVGTPSPENQDVRSKLLSHIIAESLGINTSDIIKGGLK